MDGHAWKYKCPKGHVYLRRGKSDKYQGKTFCGSCYWWYNNDQIKLNN